MKTVNCFVLAYSRYKKKKKKTKLLPTDFKNKLEYNPDLYATILVVNTKNSFAMHAVAWKIKKKTSTQRATTYASQPPANLLFKP